MLISSNSKPELTHRSQTTYAVDSDLGAIGLFEKERSPGNCINLRLYRQPAAGRLFLVSGQGFKNYLRLLRR